MSYNPLLQDFNTPHQAPPFNEIQVEHYSEAFHKALQEAREQVQQIVENSHKPTFANTIEALEYAGLRLNVISEIFFNLNSAETNDDIQALAQEISPLLSEYSNDILLNAPLFQKIEEVYKSTDISQLNEEQQMLLKKTYKTFVRNGAQLNDSSKNKLRELDKEISKLSLKFGENLLGATNQFKLWIESEEDLVGLPDFVKEAAAEAAQEEGREGTWLFTLKADSYMAFMTYSASTRLREKMYRAYASRAYNDEKFDNTLIIKDLVRLKTERAHLLGYATHADFVLEERMAGSAQKVREFLSDLKEKAIPLAKQQWQELENFAKSLGHESLQRWDVSYCLEKFKKQCIGFDDELLKPYFPLNQVIENGIFELARRLFGLEFRPNKEIPVYHKDVLAYEVFDSSGRFISLLYADFFPRKGKRSGAWMTSYRDQYKKEGVEYRPHISIVCNFTKPTSNKPSLLTFDEVLTLFHEFGHALHGMLADTTYPSLSGTHVYWDFVELPSQILENWCYEKECLSLFARHYETGEPLSDELLIKIKENLRFFEGYYTLRQLGFASLDMAYFGQDIAIEDVSAFENKALKGLELLPPVAGTCMSTGFSHIFHGSYAAGYYSYKWSEVLDADAFQRFQKEGIFNVQTATDFRALLQAGGTVHPMELFKRFRGREPKVDALLERAGLE